MNINQINSGVLAYIGDAVYELEVRRYLINKGKNKSGVLQKEAINYVSAEKQAMFLDLLIQKEILKEEELDIIKRARNYSPNSKPKHTDIVTYKKATALEALFGMLYLHDDATRIKELMNIILG